MNRRRYNQPYLSPYVNPYWDPYWYGPPAPYPWSPHYNSPPPPPWIYPNNPVRRGPPRGNRNHTNRKIALWRYDPGIDDQTRNPSQRSDRGVIYNVEAQKKLDKILHKETKAIKRKAKQPNGIQVAKRNGESQMANEDREKIAETKTVEAENGVTVNVDTELLIAKEVKKEGNNSKIQVKVAKQNELLEMNEGRHEDNTRENLKAQEKELKIIEEILDEIVTKVVEAKEIEVVVKRKELLKIDEGRSEDNTKESLKAQKILAVVREQELRIIEETLEEMVTKVIEAEEIEVVKRKELLEMDEGRKIDDTRESLKAQEILAVMREDELRIIEETLEEMVTKAIEAEEIEIVKRKELLEMDEGRKIDNTRESLKAQEILAVMREDEEVLEEMVTKVAEAEEIEVVKRRKTPEKDNDDALHWAIHMCMFSIVEKDIKLVQEENEKVGGKEEEGNDVEAENIHWAISLFSFD